MTAIRHHSSLPRTRIGAVPFLNAIPLIYGLEDRVQFFAPAKLSEEFDAGRIDVGLLPVVEYFKDEGRLALPGMAIGSTGPVQSVKLFLHKPLKQIRRVAVDKRSRTSTLLLRVLLELRHKLFVEYVPADVEKDFSARAYDAALVIGDQALKMDGSGEHLDLAGEWVQWTGLPFVFALWQVRKGFSDGSTVQALEKAAADGKGKIDHIASLVPDMDHDFVRKYLSETLCYDLAEDQEQGIQLFVRFLTQLKVPVKERNLEYFDRRDIGKGLIRIAP